MSRDDPIPAEGFDWESAEDLTALSEPELRALLSRVGEEARIAAYRHEVLRGRLALIRSELTGRGALSLSSGELARVLLSGIAEEGGRA